MEMSQPKGNRAMLFSSAPYALGFLIGAAYNQKTFPRRRRTPFSFSQGPASVSSPSIRASLTRPDTPRTLCAGLATLRSARPCRQR